jgi:hypothetical protein
MRITPRAQPHQKGSSVLIILVLLACMAMWIAINTSNLHVLREEMKRIEKQQKSRPRSAGLKARHVIAWGEARSA